MPVTWELYPIEDLACLSATWDNLNASGPDSPLLDADFFQSALNCFGNGHEVIAICYADQQPIAATLLEKVGTGRWATFQPAQAPLGPWLAARPDDLPFAHLARLSQALPGNFQIGVTQQDPQIHVPPSAEPRVMMVDYIETAAVTISGSFEDYWARRGKNLRQNLRRQRNRLNRESIDAKLVAVTKPGEVPAAVDAYGLLESQGWKGAEGTAVHPDNLQGRFYREMLGKHSERDETIVFQYYYGDHLVACDLCLHRNRVLVVLKTTHDECQKTSSPALLMREEVMRRLFRGGAFDRLEFYGKIMDWHTKWTPSVRLMYHVNFWRWPWLRRLAEFRTKLRTAPDSKQAV